LHAHRAIDHRGRYIVLFLVASLGYLLDAIPSPGERSRLAWAVHFFNQIRQSSRQT